MTLSDPLANAFLWLSAPLALAYLLLSDHAPSERRSALKTGATLCLLVAAVISRAPLALSLALAGSTWGDFALSRRGDAYFKSAIAGFALAHLAYVALFLDYPRTSLDRLLGVWPHGMALVAAALAMAVLLWPRSGGLRGPVMAYIVIVTLMGLAALSQPYMAVRIGALMFILSDAILAAEVFLLPPAHRLRRITPYLVWSLYWLAQALFLLIFH